MALTDRRGDWQNSVDASLVNLNSAQKSADANLTEIETELAEVQTEQIRLDRILRGDPEDNLDGLIATMRILQKDVARFNSILDPDHTGHGGLLKDIEQLLGKRERWIKREGYLWTFLTAVVVQALILAGLVIVNWNDIKGYVILRQHIRQTEIVERQTKKAKAERDAKRKKGAGRKLSKAPTPTQTRAPAPALSPPLEPLAPAVKEPEPSGDTE